MNVRTFSVAGLAVLPATAGSAGAEDNARAIAFYEQAQGEYYGSNPVAAACQGMRLRYGEQLDAQGQLSYDLFLDQQRRRIEGWSWRLLRPQDGPVWPLPR